MIGVDASADVNSPKTVATNLHPNRAARPIRKTTEMENSSVSSTSRYALWCSTVSSFFLLSSLPCSIQAAHLLQLSTKWTWSKIIKKYHNYDSLFYSTSYMNMCMRWAMASRLQKFGERRVISFSFYQSHFTDQATTWQRLCTRPRREVRNWERQGSVLIGRFDTCLLREFKTVCLGFES